MKKYSSTFLVDIIGFSSVFKCWYIKLICLELQVLDFKYDLTGSVVVVVDNETQETRRTLSPLGSRTIS